MEEERRFKLKQESISILKSREAPFAFWIRDQQKQLQKSSSEAKIQTKSYVFRANPLPKNCTVLVYQEMETKGKEERKRRI